MKGGNNLTLKSPSHRRTVGAQPLPNKLENLNLRPHPAKCISEQADMQVILTAAAEHCASPHATIYAVRNIGGALGRISANATWMMPPARPRATPMRHAMV
jgi:hypothetical protein